MRDFYIQSAPRNIGGFRALFCINLLTFFSAYSLLIQYSFAYITKSV